VRNKQTHLHNEHVAALQRLKAISADNGNLAGGLFVVITFATEMAEEERGVRR
jgi:hypothetical protein